MSRELYEVIALAARYAFTALMLLIVARAWRITLVDSRRASTLRRFSPETGICGELVVTDGGERAKRGMKYPVIREGLIGSSARADVRIRHSSVRRRHAYFQMTDEDTLTLRGHAGAPLYDALGNPLREVELSDGEIIVIGQVTLLLVLSAQAELPHRAQRRHGGADDDADEALFDAEAVEDDPFDDPERADEGERARHARISSRVQGRPGAEEAADADDPWQRRRAGGADESAHGARRVRRDGPQEGEPAATEIGREIRIGDGEDDAGGRSRRRAARENPKARRRTSGTRGQRRDDEW